MGEWGAGEWRLAGGVNLLTRGQAVGVAGCEIKAELENSVQRKKVNKKAREFRTMTVSQDKRTAPWTSTGWEIQSFTYTEECLTVVYLRSYWRVERRQNQMTWCVAQMHHPSMVYMYGFLILVGHAFVLFQECFRDIDLGLWWCFWSEMRDGQLWESKTR